MALEWDNLVLGPAMDIFGEGSADDPSSWPTFTAKGGVPFQLTGAVFDSAYRHVTELAEGAVETAIKPMLGVRAALFLQTVGRLPLKNDTVSIPSAGRTFTVSDVQPDGHGHLKLILM